MTANDGTGRTPARDGPARRSTASGAEPDPGAGRQAPPEGTEVERARDLQERLRRAATEARAAREAMRHQRTALRATRDALQARLMLSRRTRQDSATVVVADDEDMTREVVAAVLGADDAFEVVAEVGSGAEAIAAVVVEQPDLLVVDYDLGDMTAVEVVSEVQTYAPLTRIVLHSARAEVQALAAALGVEAGAAKDDGLAALLAAARTAVARRGGPA